MSVVAQRYGYSVHHEVMNDKDGQVFSEAVNGAKTRLAGAPHLPQTDAAPRGPEGGAAPATARPIRGNRSFGGCAGRTHPRTDLGRCRGSGA